MRATSNYEDDIIYIMCDSLQTVMKPLLHCDEESHNIKFCTNLGQ